MKLSELRRIAEARTKGEWRHELERYSARNVIALSKDEPWIAHTQPANNGDNNADFIAAMANHADAILDVLEAVEDLTRGPKDSYVAEAEAKQLRIALAKLEEIK